MDLQHAVSLLRQIYTTRLVPHQQHRGHEHSAVSDDADQRGVVAAVGSLIDTVALIGDELAERTRVDRPTTVERTNISVGNVSAAVHAGTSADGRRYSHADHLFQAAHVFHLLSIIILGVFVVEVETRSLTVHSRP